VLQEFQAILGPELKQVVGRPEPIDDLNGRVRMGIKKLEDFEEDVFNANYEKQWLDLQKEFN
jgi:hypothetical protein